jgi:hypothetical protein
MLSSIQRFPIVYITQTLSGGAPLPVMRNSGSNALAASCTDKWFPIITLQLNTGRSRTCSFEYTFSWRGWCLLDCSR